MIHRKQHWPFFATSSSSWMLLLLSFYFSWMCPAEPLNRPCCYETVLVEQKTTIEAPVFSKLSIASGSAFKSSIYLPIFSFQPSLAWFQIQVKTNWNQRRQLQNSLPAPSTFYQFQTHLPRSIASC